MKLSRRNAMIALGSLGLGSGAAMSSAAFSSSAGVDNDIRVVVSRGPIDVRAGAAFRDEDGEYVDDLDDEQEDVTVVSYDEGTPFFDDGGLEGIDSDDTPIGTVNDDRNDELAMEVAATLEDETEFVFDDFLQITNNGDESVEVGISYVRDEDDPDSNQYGDDVKLDGDVTEDEIAPGIVQHVFQFRTKGAEFEGQLSPDASDRDLDEPEEFAPLDPGQTRQIDLKVDFTDFGFTSVSDVLEGAADPSDDGARVVVDLLDEITVGVEDPDDTSD